MAELYIPQAINLVGMASEVANFQQAKEKMSLLEADINDRKKEAANSRKIEEYNKAIKTYEIMDKIGASDERKAEFLNKGILPHLQSDGLFIKPFEAADFTRATDVGKQLIKLHKLYTNKEIGSDEYYNAVFDLSAQDPEHKGVQKELEKQEKEQDLQRKGKALDAIRKGTADEEDKKALLEVGFKPEEINLLFPKPTEGETPTLTQKANNAEIEQSRTLIQRDYGGLTALQIKNKTRKTDDSGLPNPDFDQNLAKLVQAATQRMVGDDPGYQSFTSKYLGAESQTTGGGSYINKILQGE